MILRKIQYHDYEQFIILINDFRNSEFTLNQFKEYLDNEKNSEIYVLENNNILIGAGTILLEKKFIHNISLYAHLEDIIIKKEYQSNGYGKLLINSLIKICQEKKCFKILLDCNKNLIEFYKKCGFNLNGNQMVIYI